MPKPSRKTPISRFPVHATARSRGLAGAVAGGAEARRLKGGRHKDGSLKDGRLKAGRLKEGRAGGVVFRSSGTGSGWAISASDTLAGRAAMRIGIRILFSVWRRSDPGSTHSETVEAAVFSIFAARGNEMSSRIFAHPAPTAFREGG